jgi:predicted O-methyltransferase YrrM
MNHFYQNIEGWFDFEDLYSEVVASAGNEANFVEIGSWKGKSSAYMAVEIANSGKDIKFHCVDTWLGSLEHQGFGEVMSDSLFNIFSYNMHPVREYYTAVRKPSIKAAKEYSDNFFDFIFIDASHEYADVLADLEAWYPKLKDGGVFAGHDYELLWPGVIRAVDEFAKDKNLKVCKTSQICFRLNKI